MDEARIVSLFFDRNEMAISASKDLFGKLLYQVSYRILHSAEDADECVNDTWMKLWTAIPPLRPASLKAYAVKVTRNLSLNRLKEQHAKKRGGEENEAAFEELSELLTDGESVEGEVLQKELAETIDAFLKGIKQEQRIVFVQRYFYGCSMKEIGAKNGLSEANVKKILSRLRMKLKTYLETAGYEL